MTDVDYHRRIQQFATRRQHSDPRRAARAQGHLDWWLDKYADFLRRAGRL